MKTNDLDRSLPSLFSELVNGASVNAAFVLNGGDRGLLAALDGLSAEAASKASHDGGTIAGHVNHLRYGLSLMNRWAAGEENPFAGADWAGSWKTTKVSDTEWKVLRDGFRSEVERWHRALQNPREVSGIELDGVIASVVHLAYHMGAMRQIDPTLRGPKATD